MNIIIGHTQFRNEHAWVLYFEVATWLSLGEVMWVRHLEMTESYSSLCVD